LLLVAASMVAAAIVIPIVVPGSAVGRSLSTIIGSASGLSSNGRSALWAEAYKAFGLHPLAGIGTGGFSVVEPAELYPHNLLLETGVELGVVAVVAVGVMIAGIARRLTRLWQTTTGERQI